MTQSVAGPKLLPSDPIVYPIPEFRKPFMPTFGLSIAPVKTPNYEGTGGLYLRLSKDDDHAVLLTAAHVVRPPPAMSRNNVSQLREEIVALGNKG